MSDGLPACRRKTHPRLCLRIRSAQSYSSGPHPSCALTSPNITIAFYPLSPARSLTNPDQIPSFHSPLYTIYTIPPQDVACSLLSNSPHSPPSSLSLLFITHSPPISPSSLRIAPPPHSLRSSSHFSTLLSFRCILPFPIPLYNYLLVLSCKSASNYSYLYATYSISYFIYYLLIYYLYHK